MAYVKGNGGAGQKVAACRKLVLKRRGTAKTLGWVPRRRRPAQCIGGQGRCMGDFGYNLARMAAALLFLVVFPVYLNVKS